MLLNVTDRGIPKVPDNFPTCPINEPDHIDEVKLVPIESIGNSRDGLDGSSGADLSHFSFVLLLIKLLWIFLSEIWASYHVISILTKNLELIGQFLRNALS